MLFFPVHSATLPIALGVTALSPTYFAENISNPSIAFPLRLRRGLLQKTDEREAYLMLFEIMARTPRGSWGGHPSFGFHEFFTEVTKEGLSQQSRIALAEKTAAEINSVLADIGLTRYCVDSLQLDSVEREGSGKDQARWAGHLIERRGVTLMVRESNSDRASGYSL